MGLILFRLSILFISSNLKIILTTFLGFTLMFELYAFDVRVSFIDRALAILPFNIGIASGITFLIFWPWWLIRVIQQAVRRGEPFGRFIRSDSYLELLADWTPMLNSTK